VEPLRQIEALVGSSVADPTLRSELESALTQLLAPTSTFEARRFACTQLAIIGTDASLPALARMLDDPESVGIACLAIGSRPSAKADEILRQALASATGPVRQQVIGTVGVRRDPLAVRTLAELARADDPLTARAAISALGHIANSVALTELAALRRQGNPGQAEAAVQASLVAADKAVRQGDSATATAIYNELLADTQPAQVRRAAFEGLLRLDADGGEKRILEALRRPDPTLKPSAISRVPALKSPAASGLVAREMLNLAAPEQVLLIQALAMRNDADARSAIQQQLDSGDPTVRLASISALGRAGDAATVPVLVRALAGHPDPDAQKAVELALASLGGGDDVDKALMAQVLSRVPGPKAPILGALVRRANPLAMRIFVAQAGGTDPTMAKLAFQGLSRIAKPEDTPRLLAALSNLQAADTREEAQAYIGQALSRLNDAAKNSSAVREALHRAKTVAARCSLLSLLVICPDPPALETVTAALTDGNPQVKNTALRTLADWPDTAAWDTLATLYREAASEPERAVAFRGLARLLGEGNGQPNDRLITRYRDLLATAKAENDRKLVLGALGGCAHPEALRLAVSLLGDADVSAEARAAVKKIAEAIKPQYPQAAEEALKQLNGTSKPPRSTHD
jgi:HEAT repeat protein